MGARGAICAVAAASSAEIVCPVARAFWLAGLHLGRGWCRSTGKQAQVDPGSPEASSQPVPGTLLVPPVVLLVLLLGPDRPHQVLEALAVGPSSVHLQGHLLEWVARVAEAPPGALAPVPRATTTPRSRPLASTLTEPPPRLSATPSSILWRSASIVPRP